MFIRLKKTRKLFRSRGLTRVEVLLSTVTVGLATLALAPALGSRGTGGSLLPQCLSNLRQIGTAMQMYFQENNDWFPWEKRNNMNYLHGYYYGGHPGRNVGYPHWWGYIDPSYRDTPGGRPFNQYIYPGLPKTDILPTDPRFNLVRDVPVFCCPADTGGIWNYSHEEGAATRARYPLYVETGNSYDSNYLFSLYWAIAARGGHGGWLNISNAFVRVQLRRNAASLIMAYEDPFDFAVQNRVSTRGWHGETNRHTMLFLDGHAGYMLTDTSQPRKSGVGWKTAGADVVGGNVAWWLNPTDPDYRYRNIDPVP